MKSLFAFILMILCFKAFGQTTVVGTGEIKLGVKVVHRQTQEPIGLDSLCTGFDKNGLPINLIVPSYARATVFIVDENDRETISYSRIIDVPKRGGFDGFEKGLVLIYRRGFVYQGDSVLVAYNSPVASNQRINLSIVKRLPLTEIVIQNTDSIPYRLNGIEIKKNEDDDFQMVLNQEINLDTIHFSFKTDHYPVEIEEVYLDSEMADLMANTTNRDVFDLSTRSYESWVNKGYIKEDIKGRIPLSPIFTHKTNSLFIKLSRLSRNLEVWLEKDGTRLSDQTINDNGRVIALSELSGGNYKLVVRDSRIRYGNKETAYEFTVKSGFWQEGGYWIAILLPLFAIFFGVYRTYTKAKLNRLYLTQQLTDAELTAIRAQLNPHFLFNALSAIQNLVNKDDAENANDYIVRLSKLMRLVLNRSSESFHSLNNELEIAELYLSLEKLRTDFEYEIEVDERVDQNILVPTLLLQPYLENSVIHGIQANRGNRIQVMISMKGGDCLLQIKDNGLGQSDKQGNGKGMQMSSERLKVIRTRHGVETNVQAGPTETGYKVSIKIPNDL